jgi:hypothetical protein
MTTFASDTSGPRNFGVKKRQVRSNRRQVVASSRMCIDLSMTPGSPYLDTDKSGSSNAMQRKGNFREVGLRIQMPLLVGY